MKIFERDGKHEQTINVFWYKRQLKTVIWASNLHLIHFDIFLLVHVSEVVIGGRLKNKEFEGTCTNEPTVFSGRLSDWLVVVYSRLVI